MQIIARRTLRQFWATHNQAEAPLKAWYALVERAEWSGPQDVKEGFGTTVDFIGDNRIIFDIGGNKYRLIVRLLPLQAGADQVRGHPQGLQSH
jgi:mRNA interferase HigB